MSYRYFSESYLLNQRTQLPVASSHGERNLPRSHSSSYFRNESNLNTDNSYSREGRHISDHRIRERSFSPRDRSHLSLQRSQEPDLREYLIASQYDRKLSDIDREGPNYSRAYKDHELVDQTLSRKYNRNIDLKARMDRESMDLRNRELLSRRDYRDEKYSFDSVRDRRFSDLRDERYDSRRDRYSPDRRDQVYLSEPRREDYVDHRDKLYSNEFRREKRSSDFREAQLPDLGRSWPNPDDRHKESSDSSRWPPRDQQYREFLTESNRQSKDEVRSSDFERDWRHQDQTQPNYSLSSQRDPRCSDSRYIDPSMDHWRDRYPEQRFERPYNDSQGMGPIIADRSLNELNNQGRRMDYSIENNWKNEHPSQWNDQESFSNTKFNESDDEILDSFSSVNNTFPMSGNLKTPFVTGDALPRIEMEGAPLPKLTVLFQYLYNYNQPLMKRHVLYLKNLIMRNWTEEKMSRREGLWLPTFLECIRRHNGLAIVCADRRSYRWLLNMKLKGPKGFFFAASNADSPIRRLKLCFQVPDEGLTPNEVLRKIQNNNRGHQINFDHFKVINSKRHSGNLFMIVLADTWSGNKIKKKLNCRPLYGNRRIRINVMGKKKKKPASAQPGEAKEPEIDSQFLDELNEVKEDSFSDSYDEL